MLQQILRDLWVDPEILSELDEGQKQTLFCKMREEQVRRWRIWDQQQEKVKTNTNSQRKNSKIKKKVDFLLDVEGNPWTWVMGEHPTDKKIDDILEEEARELARKQAQKEAEELRKTVEEKLIFDMSPKIEIPEPCKQPLIDDPLEIYCSVDELREKINNKPMIPSKTHLISNYTLNTSYPSNKNLVKINNYNNLIDKRDVLQELSLNKPLKVAQKVALWEKRVMEERTSEILKRIQKKKLEAAKEAEECEKIQEQLWKEQERKAKEAEKQIREIARRAREEHRKANSDVTNSDNEAYSDVSLPGARPPGKQAVIEWYQNSEIPRRAGLDANSQPLPWFHGLIDRQEAERLLMAQKEGSFLVRVSERVWGYAISYRAADRCKHYLVDACNGHYQFLGNNQMTHNTLGDLLEYHGENSITAAGKERLLYPCPRNSSNIAILNVITDQTKL